jgi:hypothetical protein
MYVRLTVSVLALIVMYSKPGQRMVPALLTGTMALVLYALAINYFN